jgi:hypothetical protein
VSARSRRTGDQILRLAEGLDQLLGKPQREDRRVVHAGFVRPDGGDDHADDMVLTSLFVQ